MTSRPWAALANASAAVSDVSTQTIAGFEFLNDPLDLLTEEEREQLASDLHRLEKKRRDAEAESTRLRMG